MAKYKIPEEGIYDARPLGKGRMFLLGFQHMFAMFGATVLVPILTGLDVSTTLLFAGLGTLLFHLITGRKVPAFLGSSFAFLGAYGLVTASGQDIPLTYSCFGVAVAGLVYLVLALFFKLFELCFLGSLDVLSFSQLCGSLILLDNAQYSVEHLNRVIKILLDSAGKLAGFAALLNNISYTRVLSFLTPKKTN